MKAIANKLVALLIVLSVTGLSKVFAQTSYTVDGEKSKIVWLGKKITGDHHGTIKLQSSEFTVDKANAITKGKFVMDMNSIKCEDLTDATWADKLVGHLKSADFFDVATYPTATFEIKNPVQIQKGNTVIKGEMTIHGVTKPYEFKAVVVPDGVNLKVLGKLIIDRTVFGVKYGSGSFFDSLGDKTIYDEFELYLTIFANKK